MDIWTGKFFKRTIGWAFALCMLASCSGIQHDVPDVSAADEQAARADIETYGRQETKNVISEGVAQQRLNNVYLKIKPAAVDVCRYTGESRVCGWNVNYNDLREYNALATDVNTVIVFHGIIAATDNDDELAFVLAHELGHHIADHINEARKHANSGMLVSGLAMAAASHGSIGCTTYACLNGLQHTAQAGMQLGGTVGIRMYSVEQEKEADYLAAHILNLSGYDLEKSRIMLVKLGTTSDEKETSFLSSHPAGPERLASFDKTTELVRSDADGFPGKEAVQEHTAHSKSSSPVDRTDTGAIEPEAENFDPDNCRIYLPDEKVCIY